jgi:hypothetical protein
MLSPTKKHDRKIQNVVGQDGVRQPYKLTSEK